MIGSENKQTQVKYCHPKSRNQHITYWWCKKSIRAKARKYVAEGTKTLRPTPNKKRSQQERRLFGGRAFLLLDVGCCSSRNFISSPTASWAVINMYAFLVRHSPKHVCTGCCTSSMACPAPTFKAKLHLLCSALITGQWATAIMWESLEKEESDSVLADVFHKWEEKLVISQIWKALCLWSLLLII